MASFATQAKGAKSAFGRRTLGLSWQIDKQGRQDVKAQRASNSAGTMSAPCMLGLTAVLPTQELATLWPFHFH